MSVSLIAKHLVSKISLSQSTMIPSSIKSESSGFFLVFKSTNLRGELLEVLKSVEAASIDAEIKLADNNPEVKIWFEKAKCAIFDAEDLWEQIFLDDDQDIVQYENRMEQLGEIIKKLQFLVKNERIGVEEMTDGSMNVVLARGQTEQLREMEKLNSLNRKLYVSNLNYITDIENVVIPSIQNKEYLEELVLKWEYKGEYTSTEIADHHHKVLDAFRAHDKLQNLTISGYGGNTWSTWLVGVAPSFRNLVSLCIKFCQCFHLPQLGNLPSLKDLTVHRLEYVEILDWRFYGESDSPFKALEKMCIDGMYFLKTWSFPKETDEGFSSLKVLRISNCIRLESIPYLFPSLVELHIHNCSSIVELEIRGAEKGVGQSLQSLQIRSCGELRSVPESFINLRDVCISYCKSLVSTPKQMLKLTYEPLNYAEMRALQLAVLTGLQRLHLSISLVEYDGEVSLPPNLSHLTIHGASFPTNNNILVGLVKLKSLTNLELSGSKLLDYSRLPPLVSLQFLTIARCQVATIPDRLLNWCIKNLVQLQIIDCPNLECLTPSLSDLWSHQKLNIVRCPIIQLFPTSSSTDLDHLADLAVWKARLVSKLDSSSNHLAHLAVRMSKRVRMLNSESSWQTFGRMMEGDTYLLEDLMILLYDVDTKMRVVERNPVEQHFKKWLNEARDAIFDANDLLEQMLMDISEQNRVPVPTKIVHSAESSRTLEFDTSHDSAKEKLEVTGWIVNSAKSSDSAVDNFYYRWKNIIQIIHSYKKTREAELYDIINRLKSLADEKHEIMETKSFVRLSKVSIEVCHNLVEIPRLNSVQKLSLQYVGESLEVEDAIQKCDNQVLRKLAIWLSSSKAAELIGAQAALLKPFTSLRRLQLEIEDDAMRNDEVILPPNVVDVFIRGGHFDIHTRILNQLGELESLSHLEFFECHGLESFPKVALPSTLKGQKRQVPSNPALNYRKGSLQHNGLYPRLLTTAEMR